MHDFLSNQERPPCQNTARPLTPDEMTLLRIWQYLLQTEAIGVHDTFFALGGNSLMVMRLINRIRLVFHCDVTWHTVFACPTIASLARAINQQHHSGLPARTWGRQLFRSDGHATSTGEESDSG